MEPKLEMAGKFRTLTALLIASGALNIGLIVCGVLSRLQEEKPEVIVGPLAKTESQAETSMQPFFMQLVNRSFHELVSYLTNRDPLGEGYLKEIWQCLLLSLSIILIWEKH